jgi:hypothetical protein
MHGGYSRVVTDGAAGGRPVLIVLRVRRFRCRQLSCPHPWGPNCQEGMANSPGDPCARSPGWAGL